MGINSCTLNLWHDAFENGNKAMVSFLIENGLKGNKDDLIYSTTCWKELSTTGKHHDFDEIISMIQDSDIQPATF